MYKILHKNSKKTAACLHNISRTNIVVSTKALILLYVKSNRLPIIHIMSYTENMQLNKRRIIKLYVMVKKIRVALDKRKAQKREIAPDKYIRYEPIPIVCNSVEEYKCIVNFLSDKVDVIITDVNYVLSLSYERKKTWRITFTPWNGKLYREALKEINQPIGIIKEEV